MRTHSKLTHNGSPLLQFTNFRFPLLQLPSKRTKNAIFFIFGNVTPFRGKSGVACPQKMRFHSTTTTLSKHHSPTTLGVWQRRQWKSLVAKLPQISLPFFPSMHLLSPCSTYYYYYCTVHPLHVTGRRVGRRWRQQQQLFLEPA